MTLMHNNEMLAGCVPKEPPETSWTNIGDGIYLRLVGTNMVQWYSASYNASTTANTEYTFSSTLPAKYKPSMDQFGVVNLYNGTGYLSGSSTTITFSANGAIKLGGCNTAGIGISGGGVYFLH